MIREIQKKTEKRDGETFCSYDIDGQTVEIQLLTNGNGSTTKYEAVKDVTIQAGQYAAGDRQMAVEWKYPWEVDMRQRYIPGKNWTIEQTMEKWQNILNFVYPGQSIRIAPKRIQICRYEDGDSTGFYQTYSRTAHRRNPHDRSYRVISGGKPFYRALYESGKHTVFRRFPLMRRQVN